jgi:hypothetical protein
MSPHPLKRFCSNSCRLKARYERVTRTDLVEPKPCRQRKPVPAPKANGAAPRTGVPAATR